MAVIDQPVEVSERLPVGTVYGVVIARPRVGERERLKVEALRWVNDLRARRGAEPVAELPQGVRGSQSDCTLARAVSDVKGHDEVITLPRRVSEFALRFDAGAYPELVL